MKTILLCGLIVLTQSLVAQTFIQVQPAITLPQVSGSSIAIGDMDRDRDQDLVIIGNAPSGPIASYFQNNGSGGFHETQAALPEGVSNGAVALLGDDGTDIIITGENENGILIAKLYELEYSSSNPHFSEVQDTPFEGVRFSSVATADVNGDGNMDVLISGENKFGLPTTELYLNQGRGVSGHDVFIVDSLNTFVPILSGAVAFVDIEWDRDQDLVISGLDAAQQPVTKIYLNDGNGHFTEKDSAGIEAVSRSTLTLKDVDGDSFEDLFLTGLNANGTPVSNLYINTGSGSFVLASGAAFEGVEHGAVAIADIDQDHDQDIILTGSNDAFDRVVKLYLNDGTGGFKTVYNPALAGVEFGAIGMADFNGDAYPELVLTGLNKSGNPVGSLYVNDGFGNLSIPAGNFFPSRRNARTYSADADMDGDLDVLMTYTSSSFFGGVMHMKAEVYLNDGTGVFSRMPIIQVESFLEGVLVWEDVNGDQAADLIITGRDTLGIAQTTLLINDGTGRLADSTNSSFLSNGLYAASIDMADVDDDHDPDLLIVGLDQTDQEKAILYSNDGKGNFSVVQGTPFGGVSPGSVSFGDLDKDNDLDVLISGMYNLTPTTFFFLNDGGGTFSRLPSTYVLKTIESQTMLVDVNGDGADDLLISGRTIRFGSPFTFTKLYLNNGSGIFIDQANSPLYSSETVEFTVADIDQDQDVDILLSENRLTKVFRNDGTGVFSEDSHLPFQDVANPSFIVGDFDGDLDHDVLLTGEFQSRDYHTWLYLNESPFLVSKEAQALIPSRGRIYPNPVSGGVLYVPYSSPMASQANVRIGDMTGRWLIQRAHTLPQGETMLTLDVSTLPAGTYLLQVGDGQERISHTFMIQ